MGTLIVVNAFVTQSLKYDGFINIALQAKKQEQTNRAGVDNRLETPAVTTHVGIPKAQNYLATINIDMPQANDIEIYANSLLNYRDSQSSAFFRPSNHDTNTTLLYTNGFLPILNAKIFDTSLSGGVKGEAAGISFDLSNTYGYNKIYYSLNNSMNYSLGEASPTSFDNGALTFVQNMTNLDFEKNLDTLELAAGVEYKYESYKINAGDEASYIDGGSQGFPGYSQRSEVDEDRTSYALYFDSTYHFSSLFALEGALRHEHYSDFGVTTNVKLASDYKISPELLLRTSASSGFRAPSLSQSYYSNIATFGGVVSGTFQPDATVSKSLGAEDLKAEKSQHLTIGTVYRPTSSTSLSIDSFLVNVKDRIMLSSAQTLSIEKKALYKVEEASFFTNAVNTRTYGIDIKANQEYRFSNGTVLNVGLWYNYSKNRVIAFNNSLYTREGSFEQIDRMENGQPKHSVRMLSTYKTPKINYTLNLSAFSSYAQVISNTQYWFEKEWSADVDIAYKVTKMLNIAFGANNIFDAMPNKWDGLAYSQENKYYGYDSIKPYSRYSPFGYSGAYYYARVSLDF